MLLTEKERLDNAVGELSLNSLNGVIAYATKLKALLPVKIWEKISQFPERSYSLCYLFIGGQMAVIVLTPLNSLNGVIAYATLSYSNSSPLYLLSSTLNSLNGVIAYATCISIRRT